jgi:hypothetical protein
MLAEDGPPVTTWYEGSISRDGLYAMDAIESNVVPTAMLRSALVTMEGSWGASDIRQIRASDRGRFTVVIRVS